MKYHALARTTVYSREQMAKAVIEGADVKRMVMGRSPDGSVGLELRDYNGKVRVILAVKRDGKPTFQFLDDSGKVVKEFAATEQ